METKTIIHRSSFIQRRLFDAGTTIWRTTVWRRVAQRTIWLTTVQQREDHLANKRLAQVGQFGERQFGAERTIWRNKV